MFGGVNLGGWGGAVEAVGTLAALSRCGGSHNGGPFMGIQRETGFHVEMVVVHATATVAALSALAKPSFLAHPIQRLFLFYRAEPHLLPALITLHPPKRE